MSVEAQTRTNRAQTTVPQPTSTHVNARRIKFAQKTPKHVFLDFLRSTKWHRYFPNRRKFKFNPTFRQQWSAVFCRRYGDLDSRYPLPVTNRPQPSTSRNESVQLICCQQGKTIGENRWWQVSNRSRLADFPLNSCHSHSIHPNHNFSWKKKTSKMIFQGRKNPHKKPLKRPSEEPLMDMDSDISIASVILHFGMFKRPAPTSLRYRYASCWGYIQWCSYKKESAFSLSLSLSLSFYRRL